MTLAPKDTAGFPYRELGQLVLDPLRLMSAFGGQKKDEAVAEKSSPCNHPAIRFFRFRPEGGHACCLDAYLLCGE
jgi:hypothetical protein